MAKSTSKPEFTVAPPWPLIVFFFAISILSTIFELCDLSVRNRPSGPHWIYAVTSLIIGLYFWKEFDFTPDGFTCRRCLFFQRSIAWPQVAQVTRTTFGKKKFSRPVLLIVLNSAPHPRYQRQDDIGHFVDTNRGHVFICDLGDYTAWAQNDRLIELIQKYWGKVE